MKKSFKILMIITIILMLFCTFYNSYVYAVDGLTIDNYKPTSEGGDSKLKEVGNKIIGPVSMIGSLISVIAIIIMGIRYMLGSVEEKAQYKETLWPYFLGAVLVFGITTVLTIVQNISQNIAPIE